VRAEGFAGLGPALGVPARCKKDTLLEGALAGGPMPAAEVVQIMNDHGLSEKPVRSARKSLGVKTERVGFRPGSKSAPTQSASVETSRSTPSSA